jgi:putative ABC transport system permease protein
MFSLVLRGFAQRKVRVLLTGVAIALGVALMAGTYILTDTINHAFSEVFATSFANKAVVVTPKEALGRGTRSQASLIGEATLARARSVPGVAAVSGGVQTRATLLTTADKRLTSGAAPSLISALQPPRFESFTAAKGHLPTGPGEVAIDQSTAGREHLKLGQKIVIAGRSPARAYTLSGIAKFAGSESFGGTSVALLTTSQAQYVADKQGQYDSINIAAGSGVSAEELAKRVRAAMPSTLTVRTGAQEAANETAELEEDLGGLRTFLLVFAYVALVVGAFIIFNTFSITVAQRTRELGLLRTLGASRRQIMLSVVQEGLLLGVGGAVLGLFGGILLAPALNGLFKALGADLPDNGTVLEARTVIVSLAVGIVVTVLAGLPPALRSMRVPPVAAMREGTVIPPRPLPTRRTLILRFAIALIVVLALGGLLGHGVGVVLVVVWALRAGRLFARLRRGGERPPRRYRVVPALAGAIGTLVSWRGITGRLARENSMRQPGRTMVTALALTIGIGLVAFISVLASSTEATIDNAVHRSFAGSLIIENTQAQGGGGIPGVIAPAIRQIQGVGTVTAIAFTQGTVRDPAKPHSPVIEEDGRLTAIEPESFGKMYKIEWQQGSAATLASLGQEGVILSKKFATAHKLKVGRRLSVLTPESNEVTLTVRGIAKEEVVGLLSNLTISRALASSRFGQREDGVDFVSYAPGANAAQTRGSIDALLRHSFPQARSQTAAQFTSEQRKGVDKLLLLVYVLLALSVIVSLFGIVNTLILSIYERTRELGMMRAIGTSRRQVRQMIRYESLITALIGGVLGLVIGVIGAILVTKLALSSAGYVLSVPVGTLIVLLIAAGIAGVLAAQLPARRAARLDLLQALVSE